MQLPLAHLCQFEEDPREELQAHLQATHSESAHSHEDDEGSHSQSQGSGKDGTSGDVSRAPEAAEGKPPKDLPCPRCQSMNTKFCYYNNYSVNQPRHFCRNCQRYWTVGGTLRNVRVGGGSRKKSSRSRSRSDPYFRPGVPATGSEEGHNEGDPCHGLNPAMATIGGSTGPLHSDGAFGDAGYPEFPFHPSQLLSFFQLAFQPSHGLGLPLPSFLDSPGFAMTADEEAELQAFYEATTGTQSGIMRAAAMMSSGMWVPELEPAHVELMHKAAMWAEAQRLQSMARLAQAQAVAWADQERECKPVVSNMSSPPNLQQWSPAMEDIGYRHQQANSSLHRRAGFWETALMHSRPSKRPTGSIQTPQPWDDSNRSSASANPQVDAEPGASPGASGTAFLQAGYDVESPWAPGALNSSNPEMFY